MSEVVDMSLTSGPVQSDWISGSSPNIPQTAVDALGGACCSRFRYACFMTNTRVKTNCRDFLPLLATTVIGMGVIGATAVAGLDDPKPAPAAAPALTAPAAAPAAPAKPAASKVDLPEASKREVKKLHTGFRFTEGPTVAADGSVFFSDLGTAKIHRLATDGTVSEWVDNTGGADGLATDGLGRLISCQFGGGKLAAYALADKKLTILAEEFEGKKLGQPNDVCVDGQNNIYFTDTWYRAGTPTQGTEGVYFLAINADGTPGKMTRLISDLKKPNGVRLSKDGKWLYVVPAGAPVLRKYAVSAPGVIDAGVEVCTLPGGSDGFCLDQSGNAIVCIPGGKMIVVVNASGKIVERIDMPERPINCCLGGADFKTLYITASTSLYSVQMDTPGWSMAKHASESKPTGK
jgi:gluconolactonase